MSQADYRRRQVLNRKTFSVWTRRVQVDLSVDKDAPLDLLPVQLEPSLHWSLAPQASVMLRLAHGAQLDLSTTVSPHWLAEWLRCLA